MSTVKSQLSHVERTAAEPRDESLHPVTISHIQQLNSTIRLFRLQSRPSDPPITFQPGQWLDVYVPGISKAGGFTITSTPSRLHLNPAYLELAIQRSPSNPPAAWLWREEKEIMGQELQIRVGGSFVWPPPIWPKRVVFIAGGVGINPLISMVTAIEELKRVQGSLDFEVKFLYSTRVSENAVDGSVLFWTRLLKLFGTLGRSSELKLFATGTGVDEKEETRGMEGREFQLAHRRIEEADLLKALGAVETRKDTVCYICGVPAMTDEFVDKAKRAEGMIESNVLSEKWW